MTKEFPWGKVVKVHKIEGLPDVTEYIVSDAFEDAGKTSFNVSFPSGSSCSYPTLDEALLGSLCEKHGSEESLPYVIKLVYSDYTAGYATPVVKSSACNRIYDLLVADDPQAHKEARRYLQETAPELYAKLP